MFVFCYLLNILWYLFPWKEGGIFNLIDFFYVCFLLFIEHFVVFVSLNECMDVCACMLACMY